MIATEILKGQGLGNQLFCYIVTRCVSLDRNLSFGIMQDEKYFYHRKSEIKEWLKIKSEYECFEFSDENLCVINFRGGEYVGYNELFLGRKYWIDAIQNMKKYNSIL